MNSEQEKILKSLPFFVNAVKENDADAIRGQFEELNDLVIGLLDGRAA